MSQSKGNKKTVEKKQYLKLKLLPLQFVLAVLPMILYLYSSDSGYGVYPWNSSEDYYFDVFLHGKMVAFLIVAAITLVLAVYKTVKMDKGTRKQALLRFLPLFIYLGFVLLSTVCSENISYSVFGSMDAKEPVGVLAGYVIVAFYAYIVIESMEDVKQLVGAAVAGSACMALTGVLQAIGKDPLATEFVQRLFAGNGFVNTYGLMKLTFPVGQAYGTLFNPNYVGTYVAMYTPLLLIGLVLYKTVWKKAVCGAAFVGLLVMLFASQSRTGLIAIAAVAVMALVFLGRSVLKKWYVIVPGIAAALAVFFVVDIQRDHLLTERLKEMFTVKASEEPVQGVDTTGNGVRVLYKNTEFTVRMPVSGSDFSYVVSEGEEQKEVFYNEDKSYGYFMLDGGEEIAIQTAVYEGCYAFGLEINGRSFYFTNQLVKGNYKYINDLGRLDECVIPANVFPGYEEAASGRGYVWGRTIPLLLNTLIAGSGPDTFGIVFPQNDYVARYRAAFDNTIFTRPHNFYLQMGVQTGVLSLLAFLVFNGIYFVGSCKRYCFRKPERAEEWLGFALFLSTVGFMASGLANDSLIVVTPVYYVVLGMGMITNHKLCPVQKREKKNKEEGTEN